MTAFRAKLGASIVGDSSCEAWWMPYDRATFSLCENVGATRRAPSP